MKVKLLIASIVALNVGACADIQTRGLASCSGIDRRPLNSDLWGWQETAPEPKQTNPASKPAPKPAAQKAAPVAPAPLSFVPVTDGDTTISQHLSNENRPRWNVEASLKPCARGE